MNRALKLITNLPLVLEGSVMLRSSVRRSHFSAALAVAALVSWSTASSAAILGPLEQWGTGAATATVLIETTFSTTGSHEDGALQQDTAFSETGPNAEGSASSSAELDPSAGIATPTLKMKATSSKDLSFGLAAAIAVEVYTNTTASILTHVLDLHLHANNIVLGTSAFLPPAATVQVDALVVTVDSTLLDSLPDVGGLSVVEVAALLDTALSLLPADAPGLFLPSDPLFLSDTGPLEAEASLEFTLEPGQSAYFLAYGQATAFGAGSVVDAFGTFSASFGGDGGQGLMSESNQMGPASIPAPEPAPLALILAGALAVLASRKRRGKHCAVKVELAPRFA